MTPFEILTLLGLGAQGVSSIGQGLGIFQTPEERAKEAQRRYLTANLKEWEEPNYQFDPNKFEDVLSPIRERQQSTLKGMGNAMALRGLGRGGIAANMQIGAERRGTQDLANTSAGLYRQDEEQNWQRAYKKYLADAERAKIMASLQ